MRGRRVILAGGEEPSGMPGRALFFLLQPSSR